MINYITFSIIILTMSFIEDPVLWELLQFILAVICGVMGTVTITYIKKQAGELPSDTDILEGLWLGAIAAFVVYVSMIFNDWKELALASFIAGLSAVEFIRALVKVVKHRVLGFRQ